jgi:phosphosulfolactate phosphohydrolase-like enzyme
MKFKEIKISFPWDLPEKLSGPAVMFDVNAASHNIAYLITKVKELYVVTHKNVHFALKEIPDAVLIGESDDPTLQNIFVSTNSASNVIHAEVKDKKVILITFNGTQTLNELWDKGARPVITGHFVNLHTVTNWLFNQQFPNNALTLIPSGGREKLYSTCHNLLEDLLCAEATKDLLCGKTPDFEKIFAASRKYIYDHNPQPWPTKEKDLALIFTAKDRYPVVPVCEMQRNGIIRIRRA